MIKNTILNTGGAEGLHFAYVNGGHKVPALILWFKAELVNHPKSLEKYSRHDEQMLTHHTRYVEHLAREMRDARLIQESLPVV